ncbi:hypothetical protein [Microbacterium panaciterrae]|uniref:Uncharacterized protein n=1 Tax=Microbacterium panaciterrae TaxID=985759 RepID=A0ABP8P6E3_9MICO
MEPRPHAQPAKTPTAQTDHPIVALLGAPARFALGPTAVTGPAWCVVLVAIPILIFAGAYLAAQLH